MTQSLVKPFAFAPGEGFGVENPTGAVAALAALAHNRPA
jgi:hypothetical protein